MIPRFPEFKHLDISDRSEVESITRLFPPYSDFNFTSLICYDVHGDCALSLLNGNLVIRLRDYLTGQPFFSFLGDKQVPDTIDVLLGRAAQDGISLHLRLVPATCVGADLAPHLSATLDEAASDYVVSVEQLLAGKVGKLKDKASRIRQFQSRFRHQVVELDLRTAAARCAVEDLCSLWQSQKGKASEAAARSERVAIRRCLSLSEHLTPITVGVLLDDRLVGFTINEVLSHGFYMGHFGKSDRSVQGAGEFLEVETARVMAARGCSLLNNQQDLGLPGLRQAKRSWMPVGFLEKLTITASTLVTPGLAA